MSPNGSGIRLFSCSRIALDSIARSARGDVRWVAAVVVARTGPRAAVLRRSEPTCSSSVSDDKVGGFLARSAASGSEQQTEEKHLRSLLLRAPARDSRRSQLDSSAARASRSVRLLAPLAVMFAGLPPSWSELTKRKSIVRHLLLQIGGANIENPPPSSSLAPDRAPPCCGGASRHALRR